MRYTYIGAGGIGGLQGCWMARAGLDVTFVDRWVEHVDEINAGGMYIDGSRGKHRINVRAVTPDHLADLAPLEAVVVAVKSQDTRAALEQLLPYSTPETFFVSMQAGMNLPTLISVVGKARAIGADPNYGGALVNPGHVEAGFPNYIHVGEIDGRYTPRLRRLREDLTHWTPTYMTDNIVGTVWSKFAYGSQIVCTAITDLPSGEALADPRHRLIAGSLVREAIRISDRLGVRLEPFDFFDPGPYRVETPQDAEGLLFWIEHAWPRHEVFRKWSNHRFVKTGSGMRWDIAHRRRSSETTAMMQALIDEAARAGLEMPLNRALLTVIQEIERGERQLSAANFDDLLRVIEDHHESLPVPA